MRIVVLDAHTTMQNDLDFSRLHAFGDVSIYKNTPAPLVIERAKDAEIVLTNKTPLTREVIEKLPYLKFIALLSTGYNVINIQAAQERGILISNVPDYSTQAVAQHVFALLLELCNRTALHWQAVRDGEWSNSRDFCLLKAPMSELYGKTMGIIGYGKIGKAVAKVARALDMQVAVTSRSEVKETDIISLPLEGLLRSCDVVSLHCPLTPQTTHLIDERALAWMKPTALLINTSRGPVVDEPALAQALQDGLIAGAGLDVMETEPPPDSPLFTLPNCVITPHIAWGAYETRKRLFQTVIGNIHAYIQGKPQNLVV